MESVIMLGTGNATVTKCYNTCFAMKDGEEYFLVDTGGGNGILGQLEKAEIPLVNIHHIFISHEHTDHVLGVVWLIRMIATQMRKGNYAGTLNIYCHKELEEIIMTIVNLTIQKKFTEMIGGRILFDIIEDGQTERILEHDFTFFDIHSTKAKQFGFMMKMPEDKKFTFLGDEPYRETAYEYAVGA